MTKLLGKQNGMFGYHHTDDAKRRIGNAQRNKKVSVSKATKQKLRESHLGCKNYMFGKHHSKEHKQLLHEKALGRPSPMKGKTFSLTDEQRLKIKEARAKQILPLKDTSIEIKIQNFLKQLGIDFFTHQHIKNIEHGYQCDILIPTMNLVIECDGDYWHKYPVGNEIDHIRTKELLNVGFKVLRLWGTEIEGMSLPSFQILLKGGMVTQ